MHPYRQTRLQISAKLLQHRTGLNHQAFHADSREHVDRLTVELRDKHVPVLYPHKHPYAGGEDYYAVFFEDPDRIKVEVVAPV